MHICQHIMNHDHIRNRVLYTRSMISKSYHIIISQKGSSSSSKSNPQISHQGQLAHLVFPLSASNYLIKIIYGNLDN